MSDKASKARLWAAKWRWYERNSLPWNRVAIHREFMCREAFARWPIHGNVLEALREGRLEIGAHTLFEPGVWITLPGNARVRIGSGTFLNMGVMVAAEQLVEIGDHCMLANGCFVTRLPATATTIPRSRSPGRASRARVPTRIGDNCWLGANVVVTSGVSIGERCVIGANSVVTKDVEPFSIAAGAPARVLRKVEYGNPATPVIDVTARSAAP